MEQSKKKLLINILAIMVIIGTIFGVSIAFFNYTRTGPANTISVGRIYFSMNQSNTINLTNLFPIDPTETGIMNDTTKVGTLTVEIEGDTDYADGIEYLVSSVDSNIYTSTGKTVPISLDVTVTDLGTPNTNYFTARENTNESIYKKLVGGTLVGDQMLLVGFIKPNTTSGTIEGIDGSITIKAYLDKNKILISDTYDGTESDNMGTPNSMAEGKTVFTTTEWNSLQSSGVSFKVKVEANEGIWVNGSLEEIMRKSAVMDNTTSTFVSSSSGINFGAMSSDENGKGVYIRAGTQNDTYPIMYYRGDVNDNNVVFANKCWKTVRTTDTGGVKLIYNGEYTEQNKCNNTGTNTHIDVNGSKLTQFSGNNLYNSPAYVGYMWGTVYPYSYSNWTSNAKFGSGFTWDGTNYKLTDATVTTPNDTHHYSCNSTDAEATCTSIRYVYWLSGSTKYYITISGGKGIEEAIKDMQTNTNPSNAKTQIDSWYASNMNTVTNKLEDTIWCNDRSIGKYNGWSATGTINGSSSDYKSYSLLFGAHERSNYASGTSTTKNQPSLACANKNDAFTVSNGNGNKKLTYPVALLTEDEMVLAGGLAGSSSTFYLNNGSTYYWSLSPSNFYDNRAYGFGVNYGYIGDSFVNYTFGLRPSVSLKPGTPVIRGDGTVTSPYVIGN